MPKNNLRSISDYAALCGVKKATIYFRIKENLLKCVETKAGKAIDIDKYPPVKLKRGRKLTSDKLK